MQLKKKLSLWSLFAESSSAVLLQPVKGDSSLNIDLKDDHGKRHDLYLVLNQARYQFLFVSIDWIKIVDMNIVWLRTIFKKQINKSFNQQLIEENY